MSNQQIQIGSTVVMHFTIKLSDNSIAETTKKTTPARFTLTQTSLQDPVERALVGKEVGEKVRVELSPDQGYGPVLDANIHTVELGRFPQGVELQAGDIYSFDKPNGESLAGVVKSIENEIVVVDFNHPLAGKTLLCEMEILEVIAPGMLAPEVMACD
jgi:FKBP-type peptidyl-prolyl cis-trans isomerase SlpA